MRHKQMHIEKQSNHLKKDYWKVKVIDRLNIIELKKTMIN
jgi:hypothetical protein